MKYIIDVEIKQKKEVFLEIEAKDIDELKDMLKDSSPFDYSLGFCENDLGKEEEIKRIGPRYYVLKHEHNDYYYLWDEKEGCEVCDEDGTPFTFGKRQDAEDYMEEL